MTRNEIIMRVNALRQLLRRNDYIGVKIATGRAAIEDYAKEIAEAKAWSKELNELEDKLSELPDDEGDTF